MIAAIVLVHLIGPERGKNEEIYSAANDREQAAIVFKFVAQIIRSEPELETRLKIVDSTKTIVSYETGGFYRAISAEAGTKHGLNPSLIIYDELAQAKNRTLFDVLDTSQGAQDEPLMIVISTQSANREHVLSQMIDDGRNKNDPTTIVHLHAVPDEVENVFDEKVWKQANPALGKFRKLSDMRAQAAKAKRMPSFESAFRNLYLNQRIDASAPLIPRAEWRACQKGTRQLRDGESVYLGLDLSTTTDLTSLVAVSAEDGDRVEAWHWKPGDLVRQHEDRDGAPYAAWVRDGWLDAPEGRAIQYDYVADKIAQICAQYNVLGLAYDRWRMEYLLPYLANSGLDPRVGDDRAGLRMMPWGQGWRDMSPAIDSLEASILERTFAHDGNPVLAYCFANAQVITDPAGNRKLDKAKSRTRIDGAVATVMAMGLKAVDSIEVVDLTAFLEAPLAV